MKFQKLGALFFILFFIISFSPTYSSQDISPVVLSNVELVTVDETTAAITWVTNLPADTRVQWGETDALGEENIIDESESYHMARITDLEQGTPYYYRVGSDGRWSAISSFSTLTDPGGDYKLKFAVVADAHYDADGQNTAGGAMYEDSPRILSSLVDELNQDNTLDFVVTLGDNTNGAQADYDGFTSTMDGLNVPWYPLLGNWDKQEDNWLDYYINITGWLETYYIAEHEGYNIIILDSAVQGEIRGSIDDEQFEWLEDTLDENYGVPTLIFMHHMADRTDNFGVDEATKRRLEGILTNCSFILSINTGHIHKNIVAVTENNVFYVTTASTVSYPIGYSIIKLYSDGYTQSFHKIGSELETSEESRLRTNTASGDPNADQDCLGEIEERSFVVPIPSNQPPTISSLIVTPPSISPGGTATVTVLAYDPDGDELSYYYDTTGGTIEGSGSTVTYQAPQASGSYTITAQVSDGVYYSAVKTAQVEVGGPGLNHAPQLTKLRPSATVVRPGEVVELEATAFDEDGDTMTFHYEASGGTISGSGAEVEWHAPTATGDYTIEAWVSDGELESATKEVTITVIEALDVDDDEGIPGFEAGLMIIILVVMVICFKSKNRRY
ncbi:MAG: fibronectin type III domain-containing protein [Thermoplasmata archaeon]|nr:fibronectin type III domain-containing protein [Thermoplasmata archaeon]